MSSSSIYSTIYKKIIIYKCENQPNTKEKEKPNFNKLLNKYMKEQLEKKSENLNYQMMSKNNDYEFSNSEDKEKLENKNKKGSSFFIDRYI
ncbi:MAG: hypothetical protein AB6733_11815 [Clostridiaceae bacterium]